MLSRYESRSIDVRPQSNHETLLHDDLALLLNCNLSVHDISNPRLLTAMVLKLRFICTFTPPKLVDDGRTKCSLINVGLTYDTKRGFKVHRGRNTVAETSMVHGYQC